MNELDLSVSDAELEAYRDAVNPMRHVKDISEFWDGVAGPRFLGVTPDPGDRMPWERASRISFRPGETTVWSGINGHGKSALTVQLALYWGLQYRKSCIASFEMLPERTIDRMLCQCAGNHAPTQSFAEEFFAALKRKIYIYDRRDRVDLDALYSVMRFCALRRDVHHFWIDSLMKCVRGEDDYNAQKDFVGACCSMARELALHIHIIHHVRKGADEKGIPSKFDSKGSGAISDQVDNFITVWRNKAKEAEREAGGTDEDKPDFLLICDKNRHGGWEGRIPLWGDVNSWHFRGTAKQSWSRGYELPARPEAA